MSEFIPCLNIEILTIDDKIVLTIDFLPVHTQYTFTKPTIRLLLLSQLNYLPLFVESLLSITILFALHPKNFDVVASRTLT